VRYHAAVQVGENDFNVAAKFPNNLAARATGRRQDVRIGDHGNCVEAVLAFGNSLENSHTLGADGQTVGGILNIAAGEDAPGGRSYGGAYAKIRKWGVRVLSRGARRRDQSFPDRRHLPRLFGFFAGAFLFGDTWADAA
jgi:hypothetical protein